VDRLRLRLVAEGGRPRISFATVARLRAELTNGAGRIVTLEGEAGQFCEGLDLDRLVDTNPDELKPEQIAAYRGLLECIETSPRPVIALVDGVALGGGVGFAAAADLVIATPRATFGLPEVLLGLIPASVFRYLVARMGVSRARRLALGQASMTATEALAAGLVDEIAADLETAYASHAKRLLRMDARALADVKALAASFTAQGDTLEAERRFAALLASPPTRARLARAAVGEPPWLEDDDEA
jgi:enoyl-CoA hydratase/carnithine racemase